MPSEGLRQPRTEEGSEQCAGVAGAGNAHGQPLVFGRVPAPCQREGDSEACARDPQHEADEVEVPERSRVVPAKNQRYQRERQTGEPSTTSADPVREQTENRTE